MRAVAVSLLLLAMIVIAEATLFGTRHLQQRYRLPSSDLRQHPYRRGHTRTSECSELSISSCCTSATATSLAIPRGGQQADGRNDPDDYYYDYNSPQQDDYGGSSYNSNNSGSYDDRYAEDDYYDDRGYGNDRRRNSSRQESSPLASIQDKLQNGDRRIGLFLLGSGMVITLLGISLFFNKMLMRLGNLLCIAGVPMTIGPGRTVGYFLQPQKVRSTACLICGILLVFVGWPILGIALEIFGVLNLFGNMFPLLFMFLKQMPIIGPLLNRDKDSVGGSGGRSRRRYDDYDDGDGYGGSGYDDRYDDRYYEDGNDGGRYDDDYNRNY